MSALFIGVNQCQRVDVSLKSCFGKIYKLPTPVPTIEASVGFRVRISVYFTEKTTHSVVDLRTYSFI
jgi:hypothetical protein